MYVPGNTSQAASVEASACEGRRGARQAATHFVEKGIPPFSTSSNAAGRLSGRIAVLFYVCLKRVELLYKLLRHLVAEFLIELAYALDFLLPERFVDVKQAAERGLIYV